MAITPPNKIELPPELLDELERMVMEEGMIISKACEEYASKIGATSSIVYSVHRAPKLQRDKAGELTKRNSQ